MNGLAQQSGRAHWIWPSTSDGQADLAQAEHRAVFADFRAKINLCEAPKSFPVKVCADARYKLMVNGEVVQTGPAKTCRRVLSYD